MVGLLWGGYCSVAKDKEIYLHRASSAKEQILQAFPTWVRELILILNLDKYWLRKKFSWN